MRIIDSHHHLYDEPGYVDKLLLTMDRLGIEKCCVSGLGPLFGFKDNRDVQAAVNVYADRLIGAFFLRPGFDSCEAVDYAFENGFKIIKVTLPRAPYSSGLFYPIWERAVRYHMPVLFHTGVVTCSAMPGSSISSWNMQPMMIEPITREFPDLKIIIAHLGIHWNADAAELARMRPNVYVDLTGEPEGWRMRLDVEGADKYLWWPDAFGKVVFGTDVHYTKIATILEQDRERLAKLEVSRQIQSRIFSQNILSMLGMNPA